MNYSDYVSTLSNMLVIPSTDANFLQVLPSIIYDAENRIRRELDLLSTIVRDQTGTFTANSRNFTFPQHFVVSESVNFFTPVGTTTTRNQLVPTTQEFLDAVWGNEAAATSPSLPQYYAMITDQTIIVGPPPDAAYTVEVTGTVIPAPLSATNTTTWISTYLTDLFLAESLVFGYGYMKDYGAMSDDPRSSVSWESHYQSLWQSANTEETRKKYAAQGWTAKQPSQISTPPRA